MAAKNRPAAFFTLAILLLTAASPPAAAAAPPPATAPPPSSYTFNLVRINVSGRLCCTPTGYCPPFSRPPLPTPPLSDVAVQLTCRNTMGAVVNVGSGKTNTNGSFAIRASGLKNIPSYPLNCTVAPTKPSFCPEIILNIRAPVVPLNTITVGINGFVINQSVTGKTGLFPAITP